MVPGTLVPPSSSWSDWDVTVAGSTGSLNTTMIAAFRGTSTFLCGGSVRTTTGGRLARTAAITRSTTAPLPSLTFTSIESPTCAPSATGSNPPSMSSVVTLRSELALRIVARTPAGAVPEGSATNTRLSPKRVAVAAVLEMAVRALAVAAPTTATGSGFDTSSGLGGGGGGGGGFVTPDGLSEQATNPATRLATKTESTALRFVIARSW